MKAKDFIKKFGWEKAKNIVAKTENIGIYVNEKMSLAVYNSSSGYIVSDGLLFTINRIDLKKYTDAYELVKDLYGIDKAREYADSEYTAPELSIAIKQAITLVEEVGECDG